MPRKNIRWTHRMVARIGLLKIRGLTTRQIVEHMQARYTDLPELTIKRYSREIFPNPEKNAVRTSFFAWGSKRLTPEQLHEKAKKGLAAIVAALTPKQLHERALTREAAMSPERRREKAKKGLAAIAALTPEQRIEKARKSAKSKRKKLFEFAEYLDELPVLNLLPDAEREKEFKNLSPLIDSQISKFKRREDFGDIRQEADIACWIVLSKWDKKMDLSKLVKDSVRKALIEYFSKKKAVHAQELQSKDIERFEG